MQVRNGTTVGQGAPAALPWAESGEIGIEALLVWTYTDQRAAVICGHGLGLYEGEATAAGVDLQGRSGDGVNSLEEIAALGCRVDTFGGSWGLVHNVAETVHGQVMRLPRAARTLVIKHAGKGTRPTSPVGKKPYYKPVGWQRLTAHERARGVAREAMWEYSDDGGKVTPLMLNNSPDQLAAMGDVLVAWVMTLQDLAAALEKVMDSPRITPPLVKNIVNKQRTIHGFDRDQVSLHDANDPERSGEVSTDLRRSS